MEILAVNQRGKAVTRVRFDTLPHVQYRSTRCVDEHTTEFAQAREILHGHAECRKNDDVIRFDHAEIEFAGLRRIQECHAGVFEALIDVRVVNDFADQENAAVGEFYSCLIRVIDGAIDAVAETKVLREADVDVVECGVEALRADVFYEGAVIFGGQQWLDLFLETEAAAEIRLFHRVMIPQWFLSGYGDTDREGRAGSFGAGYVDGSAE